MDRFAPAATAGARLGGCLLAVAVAALLARGSSAGEPSGARETHRPDQLILKLSAERASSFDLQDGSALSALLARHGAIRSSRPFARSATAGASARAQRARRAVGGARAPLPSDLENIVVIEFAERVDVLQLIAEVAAQPGVVHAEPNYLYHASLTPLPDEPFVPDDRYLTQDGVHFSEGAWGQARPDLWGLEKIRAIEGWNTFDLDASGELDALEARPGEGVVVAVIDSGLDVGHPDIAENLWRNASEVPDNDIDDDRNGLVDDAIGWDFVANDSDPEDRAGHGTHVAGTVAARGDNQIGVIGVAPWAAIMALKGLDDSGSGDAIALARAVRYAADMGADVINASWGGFIASDTLAAAFRYASDLGVLSIAAAGNDAVDVASVFPANLDVVLAVAATDPDDERAGFSNFGTRIAISAPGFEILSLNANAGANEIARERPERMIDGHYLFISGTSMAAPHVAGAAAVLSSADPTRPTGEIRGRLLAGAQSIDDANPGEEGRLGRGRIDLEASLRAQPRPVVQLVAVDAGKPAPGRRSRLVVELENQWIAAQSVAATLSTTSPFAVVEGDHTEFAALPTRERVDNRSDPFEVSLDRDTPIGAEIRFELALDDSRGYSEVIPFSVRVTHFADVTRQAGLPRFDLLPWRATLQDYDGDGDADAQLVGFSSDRLFENQGGTFSDAGGADIIGTSQGLFFDSDNDGDQDLLMAGFNLITASRFFVNAGRGAFSETTDASGVRGLRAFAAAVLDYDRDGRLDFVSASDFQPFTARPAGISVMRNNGDNTFSDVGAQTCLDTSVDLLNGQILPFDFDSDGDTDLLFASLEGIFLYRANGDGTFSDDTVELGLTPYRRNREGCEASGLRDRRPECDSTASMGGAVGDYDNDGDLDLFLTGRPLEAPTPVSTLYRNDGAAGFVDVTAQSGELEAGDISGIHWGNAFFDYDNDGDLDLYVTTEAATEIRTNSLYRNDGDRTFSRVTDLAFPSDTGPSGAAAAIGDYNGDGALDIYAPDGVLGAGGVGALFENLSGAQNHWVVVRLHGAISGRDAYGARVTLRALGATQLRELQTSPVDPLPLHFGLGAATSIDEIRVRWPSGVVQSLSGAGVDRTIDIAEPAECRVASDYPAPGQSILQCPTPPRAKRVVRSARLPDKPICHP